MLCCVARNTITNVKHTIIQKTEMWTGNSTPVKYRSKYTGSIARNILDTLTSHNNVQHSNNTKQVQLHTNHKTQKTRDPDLKTNATEPATD